MEDPGNAALQNIKSQNALASVTTTCEWPPHARTNDSRALRPRRKGGVHFISTRRRRSVLALYRTLITS